LRRLIAADVDREYEKKAAARTQAHARNQKGIMLRQLDAHWKKHQRARLSTAGHSPAQLRAERIQAEYKREAFEMFSSM
jgi:preprotein translocase subunit SecA